MLNNVENKSQFVSIRMNEMMMEDLDRMAKRRKISKSSYVRKLLEMCYDGRPSMSTYGILYKKYGDDPFDHVLKVRMSDKNMAQIKELEHYYSLTFGSIMRQLLTCYGS